jgi:hypothetical protein
MAGEYLETPEAMNTQWILFHLREAQEELTRTIKELESAAPEDDVEFRIAMEHLYNHVNTAWNSRYVTDEQAAQCSDEDFYKWRDFPSDISMGR